MMPLLAAAVYMLSADPASYPNAKLLVEPAALGRSPGEFHVLDIRVKAAYDAGHVPGAVHAVPGPWSRAVTEGKADAAFWKKELAAAGVTPTKPTVVCGTDVRDGCRVWWLLKRAGVPDVRLLNGGWAGYAAAGGPVERKANAAAAPPHDWTPDAAREATKVDVLAMVKDKKGAVIDARSADEFAAGHVPGAVRLEWSELIDAKTGRFKPADELAKLLKSRNIDPAESSCSY